MASTTKPFFPSSCSGMSDRAFENLDFIRLTMERAGSFQTLPGRHGVLIGISALLAAFLSAGTMSPRAFVALWMSEAVLAVGLGVRSLYRNNCSLDRQILTPPTRRFLLAFLTPILVGALLSAALYRRDLYDLLPGIWLLLYGTAAVSGGLWSISLIRWMGGGFILLGAVALLAPWSWQHWLLAAGFGGLHIVSGLQVMRRYGY